MKAHVQRIRRTIGGWPEDVRAFLFLAACVLIAWWPLATFSYCVVHGDMLDCWLPWRTFIADCLQNGEWPVWNPYQQMGYPVHADLQGPAWYPEALLLGGTIGQSIYVLQSLVIVYLLVAGMGMYRLAKQFCGSHSAALVVGIAYMLSGFFTAHVMHQYSFISGAWWPWMFAAFLRLLDKPSWRPALEAAVFQFLLLTGGNHTFTIIGAYLMLALIIVRCVQFLRVGDRRAALRLFGHLLLFSSASLIMACGVLHAWWYSAPFIERMAGMDYGMAAQNPFTWKATLSFLIPWATTGGPEITGTNITMANAHMGLQMLLLVPLAFIRKRSATENVLLVFGAVCLLASFGDALPVHRWLYSALPGLDVFRFPSYYTYFTLLCWLLPVARTLAQWNGLTPRSRTVLWVSVAVAATIIGIAIARAASIQLGLGFALDDAHANLFERMNATSIAERTIVHGIIQLALLAGFAGMLWKRTWFSTTRLVAVVAVEGVIAVLLCSWQTGISDTSPSIIHRIVEMRPSDFPRQDHRALSANEDDNQDLQPLWRNTNIFQKRVSHDGFNSFWPEQHLQLQQRWPILFKEMKAQPLVYIADSVIRVKDYVDHSNEIEWGNALAVLRDSGELPVAHPFRREDSCAQLPMVSAFSATSIEVDVDAQCRPGLLVIQQQHIPGWSARMNGDPVPILNVNGCAMGIAFTRGRHQLILEYALPNLSWLRALSWLSFLLALALLALGMRSGAGRIASIVAVSLVAGTAGWSFFGHGRTAADPIAARGTHPDTEGKILHQNKFDRPVGSDTITFHSDSAARSLMALVKGRSDWSPAFEMDIGELPAGTDDVLIIETRYRLMPDQDSTGDTHPFESFIVLSVEEHGQYRFYRTRPLVRFQVPDEWSKAWSRTTLITQVEQLRWKPGTLKAYVWNNGPGTVLLDDFRVSVMPWDSLGVTY